MDTTAYLTRHGWLGDGHSLHPSGNGIKKPLLVSRKANVLGIGRKQHDTQADQWWAQAFDATLKDVKVGVDEVSGTAEKVTFGAGTKQLEKVGRMGVKWAAGRGLYGGFVRGKGLEGTITPESAEEKKVNEGLCAGKKRKRNKEEREEKKRRWKEKESTVMKKQALKDPKILPSARAAVDTSSQRNHRWTREKDIKSIEQLVDSNARKLLKETRHESRKENSLNAIDDSEAAISSAAHVNVKPPKKMKKHKANTTG